MIRGLLADRFKLVMRVEQKRMPVSTLTVASGGLLKQREATVPVYTVERTQRPAGE